MRKDCRSSKKSDRVMTIVRVFEEEVIRSTCAYAPQMVSQPTRKINFVMKLAGSARLARRAPCQHVEVKNIGSASCVGFTQRIFVKIVIKS